MQIKLHVFMTTSSWATAYDNIAIITTFGFSDDEMKAEKIMLMIVATVQRPLHIFIGAQFGFLVNNTKQTLAWLVLWLMSYARKPPKILMID